MIDPPGRLPGALKLMRPETDLDIHTIRIGRPKTIDEIDEAVRRLASSAS